MIDQPSFFAAAAKVFSPSACHEQPSADDPPALKAGATPTFTVMQLSFRVSKVGLWMFHFNHTCICHILLTWLYKSSQVEKMLPSTRTAVSDVERSKQIMKGELHLCWLTKRTKSTSFFNSQDNPKRSDACG